MTIPKLISRIWLGPRPIPPEFEVFWDSFQEIHAGWEFRTWTSADDYSWLSNRDLFERATTWTSRSDVLRFELLAKGGIYVDVDVEPLKSLEPLLGLGAFAGYEDARNLCGAVMGAEPGHPAIAALIEALPGWVGGRRKAKPSEWAGPVFLTAQWVGRDDVTLLSRKAFYPLHWRQRDRVNGHYPDSYVIHRWAKSWERV